MPFLFFIIKLLRIVLNLVTTSLRNSLPFSSALFLLSFNLFFYILALAQLTAHHFLSQAFLQAPVILLCYIFFLPLSYQVPFQLYLSRLNLQCQYFLGFYLWISSHWKHPLWAIFPTLSLMIPSSIFLQSSSLSQVTLFACDCINQSEWPSPPGWHLKCPIFKSCSSDLLFLGFSLSKNHSSITQIWRHYRFFSFFHSLIQTTTISSWFCFFSISQSQPPAWLLCAALVACWIKVSLQFSP